MLNTYNHPRRGCGEARGWTEAVASAGVRVYCHEEEEAISGTNAAAQAGQVARHVAGGRTWAHASSSTHMGNRSSGFGSWTRAPPREMPSSLETRLIGLDGDVVGCKRALLSVLEKRVPMSAGSTASSHHQLTGVGKRDLGSGGDRREDCPGN